MAARTEATPLTQTTRLSPERLPTNTTTYKHSIHRWFNFIAGFSPEFVELCIADTRLSTGVLLDPFAGCATALLVACQREWKAVGFESHPVLARIGRAKLPKRNDAQKLKAIRSAIIGGIRSPTSVDILPDSPRKFLNQLFPDGKVLGSLLGARESLNGANLTKNDLAFLILSRIVDECSHSQTDGIYKAPTSRKAFKDPIQATEEAVGMIRDDLAELNGSSFFSKARINVASSESMNAVDDDSVDVVVTSPPYLNNFDFAEMTRMYLYFWGIANSWGEITDKVRSQLIVNTTTALKGHKQRQDAYRETLHAEILSELDAIVADLRIERSVRAGKKEYDFLVYPYFAQTKRVWEECYRCLRQGSAIHIMIADAALYGIHISTPQLIAKTLEWIGFRDVVCDFVRRRGHRWILSKRDGSKKGLGEYHVHARK